MNIKRIIPLDEVRANNHYEECADLAEIFNHEIIETQEGIWRWKPNRLMCLMLDGVYVHTPPQWVGPNHNQIHLAGVDLNELCGQYNHGEGFGTLEFMKFYMQIGYSLCGYYEVFGYGTERYGRDLGMKPRESDDDMDYDDVIQFVIKTYKGQVLKL